MPTRTQAIKLFLSKLAKEDLAALYSHNMECQVNVAQDAGELVEGEYNNRKWHGWTDGATVWKAFRIPYKANSNPEYDDREIKFDLVEHAEAIGMTGWDWVNRCSRWFAFDFDSIVGHGESGLSNDELKDIHDKCSQIPWTTIRRSSSGEGWHVYVFVDNVPTANHTEHAALARSVLGQMSAIVGYDFNAKVDTCGGNIWVWHRKSRNTNGFELIKQGGTLYDIPKNWKDHIAVVSNKRRKNLPQDISAAESFEQLTGQRNVTPLDDEHKRLITYLTENKALWWWDSDHHMLITHTHWLAKAHDELSLKGYFQTISAGSNLNEQNCFLFPIKHGAWSVRRYTPGIKEHESWDQDSNGWTRTYFNKLPDFKMACRAIGGVEDEKGQFIFRDALSAGKAAQLMGVNLDYDLRMSSRKTILKQHRDGRLIVKIERDVSDTADKMTGWLVQDNKPWTKLFSTPLITNESDVEIGDYDNVARSIIANGEDLGWVLNINGSWTNIPYTKIKSALLSSGLSSKELEDVIGGSIFQSWKLVNKPFQDEYPGNREWNRSAAQLKYTPKIEKEDLSFDTWNHILDHLGNSLDNYLLTNAWAKANNIRKGSEYLKMWIASVFQYPLEPLPYLFFYGNQNNGKSIFHEALSLLLTKGYQRADLALTNVSGHNGELEGAVLCVIEETDLSKNAKAYNRIKDWVTSPQLNIRHMFKSPYHVTNTTHWIQVNNSITGAPVFPGDTRITFLHVEDLSPAQIIPKRLLIPKLKEEAVDFTTYILNKEIPYSPDRLNIPVIQTEDKINLQTTNETALETFIREYCTKPYVGRKIKFSDFYDKFLSTLDAEERSLWSKRHVGKEVAPILPKGRSRKDNQVFLANVWWKGVEKYDDVEAKGYYVSNGILEEVE